MAVKKTTGKRANLKVEGATGVLKNLDILDKKVAELREAIKSGQPLSMGKTNLLSGILRSIGHSMGSW